MQPDRRLAQPGPAAARRFESVPGRGREITFTLEPGLTLNEALARPLAAAGLEAAAIELTGGALGPFRYVRPALAPDQSHAAYYSATFAPEGMSRLERANATFGRRDGAPFAHVHALWTEPDGARRGGHILTQETIVAAPVAARAWGAPEIAIVAAQDAETNFTLFGPLPRAGGEGGDIPLIAARLRPNEDVTLAIEAVCRAHGWRRARVVGSVGSLVGALFEGGATVPDIATEALITRGTVSPGPDGTPRASLTIALADMAGEVHAGRLLRGANPVCITFEVMLAGEG